MSIQQKQLTANSFEQLKQVDNEFKQILTDLSTTELEHLLSQLLQSVDSVQQRISLETQMKTDCKNIQTKTEDKKTLKKPTKKRRRRKNRIFKKLDTSSSKIVSQPKTNTNSSTSCWAEIADQVATDETEYTLVKKNVKKQIKRSSAIRTITERKKAVAPKVTKVTKVKAKVSKVQNSVPVKKLPRDYPALPNDGFLTAVNKTRGPQNLEQIRQSTKDAQELRRQKLAAQTRKSKKVQTKFEPLPKTCLWVTEWSKEAEVHVENNDKGSDHLGNLLYLYVQWDPVKKVKSILVWPKCKTFRRNGVNKGVEVSDYRSDRGILFDDRDANYLFIHLPKEARFAFNACTRCVLGRITHSVTNNSKSKFPKVHCHDDDYFKEILETECEYLHNGKKKSVYKVYVEEGSVSDSLQVEFCANGKHSCENGNCSVAIFGAKTITSRFDKQTQKSVHVLHYGHST